MDRYPEPALAIARRALPRREVRIDKQTAEALIQLNQQFYRQFAEHFSATRQRLQPGVLRLLDQIQPEAAVLDLGCGNGELALALADRGHHGGYIGLDFSALLLQEARRRMPSGYPCQLFEVDLSAEDWDQVLPPALREDGFEVITAFAVMHHIPGKTLRQSLLNIVHRLLKPFGQLMLSNWQFLASERLRRRIVSWERAGISEQQVDPSDFLLDWRRGGRGLRYVHLYSTAELQDLADSTAFTVQDQFYSDGEGGRLGLYQTWEKQTGLIGNMAL